MAIKHPEDGLPIDRQVYTVDEVCRLLGLRKSSAYALIARGEIPSVKLGTQIRVPRFAIEKLLSASRV